MADQDPSAAANPADAIALGAASTAKADAYLDAQIRLADLQSQNLIDQNTFELSHLRWQRFSDQLRGLLQIMTAIVGLAILAGIGAVLWNASHADGLVIESFSVPPDFAARGLTGDVLAAKVLDRLSTFQDETSSNRAASSYANNWGDDIKVQIPDTGVSIGELNRYLHQWLGHETTISGDVYRTATGIAVTARVGGQSSPTFTGPESDLDKLIEKAAESVYRATQPYRYAVYLDQHGRSKEARAEYERLIASGPPLERGWAYIGVANDENADGKAREAVSDSQRAIAARPDLLLAYLNLSNYESNLGHDSEALAAAQGFLAHANNGDASMGKADFDRNLIGAKEDVAGSLGDFTQVVSLLRSTLASPDVAGSWEIARTNIMANCGSLHDAACVRGTYAALAPSTDPQKLVNRLGSLQIGDIALGHWRDVLALKDRETALLKSLGVLGELFIRDLENPSVARAAAETGDFALADATIAQCPADNDLCMRTRGHIRAAEHKWAAADYWFTRAVKAEPTIPFADEEWGEELLNEGHYGRAIAHFAKANTLGPHFADPLEMWGEALMQKNRSDLALAKFEGANKDAPNWGRLHLKWGEALLYTGDKSGAQKQFALASHLDLSAAGKAALARMSAHG